MHKFIRMWALVAVLTGTAGVAWAATPSEFYLGLLHRGTAAYDAGHYVDAQKQLSIAAFGLVEAVEHYQLAQVYLTLAHNKLSDLDRAREAAHRVVLAERVERKYAGLTLPAEVRTAFEATANKLLSSSESGMLLRGAPMTPPPATQRTAAPAAQNPSTPPRRAAATVPPQTKPQTSQASASQAPAQPRNTLPEPKPTTPENTPPQTVTPAPQPEKPRTTTLPSQTTSAQPAKPQPTKPAQTTTMQTATTQRPTSSAPATKPGGTETDGRGGPAEPPRPAVAAPAPAPAPRALTANEVVTRLAAAERSLNAGNLNEARRAYRELLGASGLDHETLIRVAEGLYRARDFSAALSAFNRAGTLRRGEEPYRFYIAVALYETGDFARAKKELAAALPYIEITPDVARYKTKIEGSM
jgi:tetratricopeptide (TPR) repeat protein